MTDSPAVRAPLDPKEQPILDTLLGIRDKLSLLKQDRSTYVRSQDVITLYNQVIQQVEKLNGIRAQKRNEQNRGIPGVSCRQGEYGRLTSHRSVDTVLDDCFQLISLFFLTIGRNQEAPAVYVVLPLHSMRNHPLTALQLFCHFNSKGPDLSYYISPPVYFTDHITAPPGSSERSRLLLSQGSRIRPIQPPTMARISRTWQGVSQSGIDDSTGGPYRCLSRHLDRAAAELVKARSKHDGHI